VLPITPFPSVSDLCWPDGEYRCDRVRPDCEHMFVSTVRGQVRELADAGYAPRAIARELDLAPPTVDYHLGRLADGDSSPPGSEADAPVPARSTVATRARVAELLTDGLTRAEVARVLGVSKSTVSYHARRLGQLVDERCARRYDWNAVQRYYDEGHGVRACIEAFGFSAASWAGAVKRGAIRARPARTPIEQLLVADTYRSRHYLKARLVKAGLKPNRCERCGIAEWRGVPLTFALHHVNGVRNDNRLDNLELLCPNCHSQTDNFAGRNRPSIRGP
jgi:DNA-binding CsgD family transcriptional regulator